LGDPGAGYPLSAGDLDHLFAVDGHWGAVVAFLGDMDDPEPRLGLDRPGASSQSVTDGEPALFQARGWVFIPPTGFFLSLMLISKQV